MTDPIANMRVTLDALEVSIGYTETSRLRLLRNNLDALEVRIGQRQQAFDVDLADAYQRGWRDGRDGGAWNPPLKAADTGEETSSTKGTGKSVTP